MAGMNEILNTLDHLPPLPGPALKLMQMVNDGKASAAELEEVIRYDEALAALILRIGNSAGQSRSKRSFDLRECIARLGRKQILTAALQQQMKGVLQTAGRSFGLDRGELWRSAVGGALAAYELAAHLEGASQDESFLAGLLRDIGKLALDQHYGEAYARELLPRMNKHMTFSEVEREVFGIDHAEVGRALAVKWQLPDRLAAAIGFHHDPPEGEGHDPLIDVVHAADVMCLWAGAGIGCDGLCYRLAPHVRRSLRLNRAMVERIIELIWQRLDELEGAVRFSAETEERIA